MDDDHLTKLEVKCLLEAADSHSGYQHFMEKTTEGLAKRGYFHRVVRVPYGEAWKITDKGREAAKANGATSNAAHSS